MKKTLLSIVCILGCLLALNSCKKDPVLPSSLTANGDIWAVAGEGTVTLNWVAVSDEATCYIEVRYTADGTEYTLKAEKSATSIVVENLLARYGTILFTLQPFTDKDLGGEKSTVSAQCLPVKATVSLNGLTSSVYPSDATTFTDAQEETEGPIANLFDFDTSTYFHANWSNEPTPLPHYIVIDLARKAYAFKLKYTTRDHAGESNHPSEIRILVSKTFNSETFDKSV